MSTIEKSIVYSRLEEICPVKSTTEMSLSELISDTHTAFEIIGYSSDTVDDTVKKTYLNEDIPLLYEFIYQVWLYDGGESHDE